MSFSISLGNFLYRRAFWLYKPLYGFFKNRQDKFERKLLTDLVKQGDVVMDIGANIGYYAKHLSSMVGAAGHVHCFEPDEKNFAHLQRAVGKLRNVTINNKAVGPTTGSIKIYTSPELNVDHRTYKPEHYEQEISIQSIRLDDYVNGAYPVNLIKMDIQGFEMEAIKGMERTIKENPGLVLISEFWPYGLRTAGTSATAYFEHLQKLGFSCSLFEKDKLVPLELKKVKELEPQGKEHFYNILAKRKDV